MKRNRKSKDFPKDGFYNNTYRILIDNIYFTENKGENARNQN